jgi:hypothetical protein
MAWFDVITRSSDKLEAGSQPKDHSGLRKGSPSQGYGGVLEAVGGGFDKDRRYRLPITDTEIDTAGTSPSSIGISIMCIRCMKDQVM